MSNPPSQDYSASITWTQDWTAHLAANGLTITSATAAADNPAVTVTSTTVTGTGTSVTFHVAQTGLTSPTTIRVTVTANLSNGDIDQRDFPIQFTDT